MWPQVLATIATAVAAMSAGAISLYTARRGSERALDERMALEVARAKLADEYIAQVKADAINEVFSPAPTTSDKPRSASATYLLLHAPTSGTATTVARWHGRHEGMIWGSGALFPSSPIDLSGLGIAGLDVVDAAGLVRPIPPDPQASPAGRHSDESRRD